MKFLLNMGITTFKSEAMTPTTASLGNLESLSMAMVDVDYDGEVFDLDHVYYADAIAKASHTFHVPVEEIGNRLLLALIDIFGNEFREVKTREELGLETRTDSSGKTEGGKPRRKG